VSDSGLTAAKRFILPRGLAEECYGALRLQGHNGAELFIALSGSIEGSPPTLHFHRALIPEQTCHDTPDGLLVTIEGEAIFALNRECYEAGELLAGQIHAHPERAYHSGADDELALVRLPGALSIVVPGFARGPLRPRGWAVYQLREDGRWRPRPRRVKLELR
jgi:hypothetical protein